MSGPGEYLLDEQRATADTGAEKGRKLARYSLLPWDSIHAVAEHFGIGAKKYAERNWEKGMPWSWNYDALCRHLAAWWGGEDKDAETGSLHITAVAWHALVLLAYQLRKRGTDDRPELKEPPVQVSGGFVGECSAIPEVPIKRQPVRAETRAVRMNCSSHSPIGHWCCEREAGHIGDHVAWEDYEADIPYEGGRWPSSQSMAPRPGGAF